MNFSLLNWIVQSNITIKIILAILLLMSLLSWSILFAKIFQLRRIQIHQYLKTFAFSPNIQAMQQTLHTKLPQDLCHEDIIIKAGIHAFNQNQAHMHTNVLDLQLQNSERIMNIEIEQCLHMYNTKLNTLASIANIAPYIGLLGTVIGIMLTFLNLNDSNTSINQIAPHIAESLIVTAMGLIVAIPASMAYTYLSGKINHLQSCFYMLSDYVLNLLSLPTNLPVNNAQQEDKINS
jgi:biopolymer transport protein TolQ